LKYKYLILHVNGKFNYYNFPENSIIKKIDEKDLANWKLIRKIYLQNKSDSIIFATDSLMYQRFIFFMQFYIMITTFSGYIIDNSGQKLNFNFVVFILKDLSLFLLEILLSSIVIIIAYLNLLLLTIKGKS
jgi:hypothetical protein